MIFVTVHCPVQFVVSVSQEQREMTGRKEVWSICEICALKIGLCLNTVARII